ncbi:MAG: hypothetical protein EXQ57_07345 [Bryobacterales bacterium]|nr:hypothetical protein [Bryobacterales bacterium]
MVRYPTIFLLLVMAASLTAQKPGPDERLARIEENTISLKESSKKTDERIEAMQTTLRGLQDRVITVDSQNKIIIGIALAAFTIGLSFLIWLWRKFETSLQQNFKDQDRLMLEKIYQKISAPSAPTTTAKGA